MTATPNLKEIRGFVRQKGNEADAWKALDGYLGDNADLDRMIATKRGEHEKATQELTTVQASVTAARSEAAGIVAKAETEAKGIIADAKGKEKAAADRAAGLDAAVAAAQEEADRLRKQGRIDGEKLATELDGIIAGKKAESAELDTKRTTLANDIAALEKRKAGYIADIEAIRARLAG